MDYRLQGGVVLAQDFAVPDQGLDDLICYAHDRGLMHLFVPAYADALFQGGRFAWPAACPWPEAPGWGCRSTRPATSRRAHRHCHRRAGRRRRLRRAHHAHARRRARGPHRDPARRPRHRRRSGDPRDHGDQRRPRPLHAARHRDGGATRSRTFPLATVVHGQTAWVTNAGLSQVVAFDEPGMLVPPASPSRRTGEIECAALRRRQTRRGAADRRERRRPGRAAARGPAAAAGAVRPRDARTWL
ncbi:MAG: hypothetical protein R3F59_18130 [Myxococcota bacterium]